METELYKHSFTTELWGDFHVITVSNTRVVYEIINWGDEELAVPKWEREEYEHQPFYNLHKYNPDLKPIIDFLIKEKLIDLTPQ